MPKSNTAVQTLKSTFTAQSLTNCFDTCKKTPGDGCTYWTFNFTDSSCRFFSIMKESTGQNLTDVLSGEKYCGGTHKCTQNFCCHNNEKGNGDK